MSYQRRIRSLGRGSSRHVHKQTSPNLAYFIIFIYLAWICIYLLSHKCLSVVVKLFKSQVLKTSRLCCKIYIYYQLIKVETLVI